MDPNGFSFTITKSYFERGKISINYDPENHLIISFNK